MGKREGREMGKRGGSSAPPKIGWTTAQTIINGHFQANPGCNLFDPQSSESWASTQDRPKLFVQTWYFGRGTARNTMFVQRVSGGVRPDHFHPKGFWSTIFTSMMSPNQQHQSTEDTSQNSDTNEYVITYQQWNKITENSPLSISRSILRLQLMWIMTAYIKSTNEYMMMTYRPRWISK